MRGSQILCTFIVLVIVSLAFWEDKTYLENKMVSYTIFVELYLYTTHYFVFATFIFVSSTATQPVDLSNSVGLLYSIYNTSQIALRPKTSAAIKQLFFSLSQCLIWKLIKSACVTLVFKQVLKSLTRVSKLHKSSDKSCA